MNEVLEIIIGHLIMWVIIFGIALAQFNNIKLAIKATVMFLILLYLFFGYFFLIIYMGGHIPI